MRQEKGTKKKTKKVTEWLVEPLDDETNQTLANFLVESPEDALFKVLDSQGVMRNVWRVPGDKILFVLNSKESKELKFRVFTRKLGTGGPIHLFPMGKRPSKKAKAVKKACRPLGVPPPRLFNT